MHVDGEQEEGQQRRQRLVLSGSIVTLVLFIFDVIAVVVDGDAHSESCGGYPWANVLSFAALEGLICLYGIIERFVYACGGQDALVRCQRSFRGPFGLIAVGFAIWSLVIYFNLSGQCYETIARHHEWIWSMVAVHAVIALVAFSVTALVMCVGALAHRG